MSNSLRRASWPKPGTGTSHLPSPTWQGCPRTCSFCGGVHPEDALALLTAGWEGETTGKDYKRYLHPPGFLRHMDTVLEAMRAQCSGLPAFLDPIPPVKLYVYHLDQPQILAFNRVLDSRAGQEPKEAS